MKEYLKSGGILADHEWEDNFFSDLNCIQIDQVQWSLDKHPKIFFMKIDKQFLKFLVIRKPKNSHHNTEEQ